MVVYWTFAVGGALFLVAIVLLAQIRGDFDRTQDVVYLLVGLLLLGMALGLIGQYIFSLRLGSLANAIDFEGRSYHFHQSGNRIDPTKLWQPDRDRYEDSTEYLRTLI